MIPLFQANPMLADRISHRPVCRLPTPVLPMDGFGEAIGHAEIYTKRDDLSGSLFGGNKTRFLEFLLAAAHADGGNVVVGLAGTSMALAANIYARYQNIPLKTVLVRQPPTAESRANLLYFGYLGAELERIDHPDEIDAAISRHNAESLERYGHPTHVLDPVSPLGMCGPVNAGFELAAQIRDEFIPEPDLIFLAAGSLGTTAGLLVGLRAAGLRSRIVAVSHTLRDPDAVEAGFREVDRLVDSLWAYLRMLSPDFPEYERHPQDLSLAGPAPDGDPLALVEAGLDWSELLERSDRVRIEPTWTAQVIGEIARRAEKGELDGKRVLYWHTSNSRPYPPDVFRVDYRTLPEAFHRHFETNQSALINKPSDR